MYMPSTMADHDETDTIVDMKWAEYGSREHWNSSFGFGGHSVYPSSWHTRACLTDGEQRLVVTSFSSQLYSRVQLITLSHCGTQCELVKRGA